MFNSLVYYSVSIKIVFQNCIDNNGNLKYIVYLKDTVTVTCMQIDKLKKEKNIYIFYYRADNQQTCCECMNYQSSTKELSIV